MIEPQLLDRIPALRVLPGATKADLAKVAREIRYSKGRAIYPFLGSPQSLILLLEGLAKMTANAPSGIERIIYVYRPGEILGSRVLLEASPESAYQVTAMVPVRALEVSKHDFLAAGRRDPDLLMAVMENFSRRLDIITHHALSAMTSEVPIRLCQLLLDFANANAEDGDGFAPLGHSLTHETMSQIIGASRPHTSTVLGDLEESGIVQRKTPRGLLVHSGRLREVLASEGEERFPQSLLQARVSSSRES